MRFHQSNPYIASNLGQLMGNPSPEAFPYVAGEDAKKNSYYYYQLIKERAGKPLPTTISGLRALITKYDDDYRSASEQYNIVIDNIFRAYPLQLRGTPGLENYLIRSKIQGFNYIPENLKDTLSRFARDYFLALRNYRDVMALITSAKQRVVSVLKPMEAAAQQRELERQRLEAEARQREAEARRIQAEREAAINQGFIYPQPSCPQCTQTGTSATGALQTSAGPDAPVIFFAETDLFRAAAPPPPPEEELIIKTEEEHPLDVSPVKTITTKPPPVKPPVPPVELTREQCKDAAGNWRLEIPGCEIYRAEAEWEWAMKRVPTPPPPPVIPKPAPIPPKPVPTPPPVTPPPPPVKKEIPTWLIVALVAGAGLGLFVLLK